jgi:PBP1b-binding outer membrane lipoprotein LpoB
MRLVAAITFGALLAAGCATDPAVSTVDRERMDREYRTGSNFPKSRESGVSTHSREAIIREQQVGAPGPTPRPFGN